MVYTPEVVMRYFTEIFFANAGKEKYRNLRLPMGRTRRREVRQPNTFSVWGLEFPDPALLAM